jgi:hypothetical protein
MPNNLIRFLQLYLSVLSVAPAVSQSSHAAIGSWIGTGDFNGHMLSIDSKELKWSRRNADCFTVSVSQYSLQPISTRTERLTIHGFKTSTRPLSSGGCKKERWTSPPQSFVLWDDAGTLTLAGPFRATFRRASNMEIASGESRERRSKGPSVFSQVATFAGAAAEGYAIAKGSTVSQPEGDSHPCPVNSKTAKELYMQGSKLFYARTWNRDHFVAAPCASQVLLKVIQMDARGDYADRARAMLQSADTEFPDWNRKSGLMTAEMPARTEEGSRLLPTVNGAPQCAWPSDFSLIRDSQMLKKLQDQDFAQLLQQGGTSVENQIAAGAAQLKQISDSLPTIESTIRGISQPPITHYNFTFDYDITCKQNTNSALLAAECQHVNVENTRYALNGTLQIMECMAGMPLQADIGPNRDTSPITTCDTSHPLAEEEANAHGATRVAAGDESVVLQLTPGTPTEVAGWPGLTITVTCQDLSPKDVCTSSPSERGSQSIWKVTANCPGFYDRHKDVSAVLEERDGEVDSLPILPLGRRQRSICPSTSGDLVSERPDYNIGPLWGSCASKSFVYIRVYPPAPQRPGSNR